MAKKVKEPEPASSSDEYDSEAEFESASDDDIREIDREHVLNYESDDDSEDVDNDSDDFGEGLK